MRNQMKDKGTGVKRVIGVAVLAMLALGVTRGNAEDRDPSLYIGLKMCGICHKKEAVGNQLQKWQESPHAKAFETLGTPEAKAVAAKQGIDDPQTSGACLKCHSTAYNWTEEVQTTKIKPEQGVTCESCHGPGKNYKKKAIMKDREQAIAGGLVYPATKSCTLCHNDQNPAWDPERYTKADGTKTGFDEEAAVKKIAHPNPNVEK